MPTPINTNGNHDPQGGNFSVGTGGNKDKEGVTTVVTPFTKRVKSEAAKKRREAQAALKESLKATKEKERAVAEAKRKDQEAKDKAAAEAAKKAAEAKAAKEAKEKDDENIMDLDNVEVDLSLDMDEDEDDDTGLDGVVHQLNTNSPAKKRGRVVKDSGGKTKTYAQATLTTGGGALRMSSFISHTYTHPRAIIEGTAHLSNEDKAAQFIGLLGVFLTNAKMLDPFFVINPILPTAGKKDLRDAKDIPQNMTLLNCYIKISEKSMQTFQPAPSAVLGGKKKPVGGNHAFVDVVFFTMAVSCDTTPGEILTGISVEWMRAGGMRLFRKEIQAFNTFSPFVILNLCTNVAVVTIMAELNRILEEAKKISEEEVMDEKERIPAAVPTFAIRKSLPKLPNLDLADYAGLSQKQNNARKAWHVEMGTKFLDAMRYLIDKAKDYSLFEDYWGGHVMISDVVDFGSEPADIERLLKVAKSHTCYQVSMRCVTLRDIVDLDAPVPYKNDGRDKDGRLSMRYVLLTHFRIRDNSSPLFAEVHQKQSNACVEAVVPNTPEAEAILMEMDRQMPAIIKFYLVDKGLDEGFVNRLVAASCDAVKAGEMNTVKWDSEKKVLITPEDMKGKESLAAFESQAWYFDLSKLRVSPKKKTQNYTAPEALFNLDGDRSVNTLHAKNDAKRASAKVGYGEGDSTSEEEEADSASDERDHGKSPSGENADKEGGDGQKSISWSPDHSDPSVGRLYSHEAAGSG